MVSAWTPVAAEQGHLPGLGSAEVAGTGGSDAVERRPASRRGRRSVECADFDETFEGALAGRAQVHAAGEVVQVGEGSVLAGLDDQNAPGLRPTFLTAPRPKRMAGFVAFVSDCDVFDGEIITGVVDIRRKDVDAQRARIGDVQGNLGRCHF